MEEVVVEEEVEDGGGGGGFQYRCAFAPTTEIVLVNPEPREMKG
jgi:hypothetical protein